MVGAETVSLPLPEFASEYSVTTTYVTGVPNAVNYDPDCCYREA